MNEDRADDQEEPVDTMLAYDAGYADADDGRLPRRADDPDYMRGYRAAPRTAVRLIRYALNQLHLPSTNVVTGRTGEYLARDLCDDVVAVRVSVRIATALHSS